PHAAGRWLPGGVAAMPWRAVRPGRRGQAPHGKKVLMSTHMVASGRPVSPGVRDVSRPGFTLAAAVLGFFVVTLDATVVNVALPSVRADFGRSEEHTLNSSHLGISYAVFCL